MQSTAFLEFVRRIVAGCLDQVSLQLRTLPGLATMSLPVGPTRSQSSDTFFPEIRHPAMRVGRQRRRG
jgi:hypothetical protein